MIDETGSPTSTAATSEPGAGASSAVVGFCQQCGRALTESTRRRLGSGTYCQDCAALRQSPGWGAVNAAPLGAAGTVAATSEPKPALAGFLGLIPGVGAMYNGQYAKAVIHLIVFVVLVSVADNLNWVFWFFVWGWVFYQAFEAFHTAQARRDGAPLPDPFGWNDLGDRLGFVRNVAQTTPGERRRPAPPPFTPPSAASPVQNVNDFPGFQATAQDPQFSSAAAQPTEPAGAAEPSMPYTQVPYSPTFTGAGNIPQVTPAAGANTQRFPAGAVWLIALGVLFLVGNVLPSWRITGRWLVPILLAGIAFWTGGRRFRAHSESTATAPAGTLPSSLAGMLIGPALVLTLAILLAAQDAGWVPLRHSWPALLIVWGALLLAERAQNLATTDSSNLDPVTTGQDSSRQS